MSTSKTTKTRPAKAAKKKSAKARKATTCSSKASSCRERLYLRLCILLLALNFGLTGYVVHSVLQMQDQMASGNTVEETSTE